MSAVSADEACERCQLICELNECVFGGGGWGGGGEAPTGTVRASVTAGIVRASVVWRAEATFRSAAQRKRAKLPSARGFENTSGSTCTPECQS